MTIDKINKHTLGDWPRKKLSKYVWYGDRFGSIYMIIFSIFWLGCIILIFYSNRDNTKHGPEEIVVLVPFLIFWCAFLWIGIYKLNKKIKVKKLKERLLLEGNRIIATVTDIKSVWIMLRFWDSVILWRWSWFKIYAKHNDRVFTSPKIWINAPKYVEIWDKISVFIDIQNSDEYYMDLDSINSN